MLFATLSAVDATSYSEIITLIQPTGNAAIHGTYTFEADMTTFDPNGYSITFVINGVSYDPYPTYSHHVGSESVVDWALNFVTGNLGNGQYSWHVYDSVNQFTSPSASFTVDNYISMYPETPSYQQTVRGLVDFLVSATPTSNEVVSGVTMTLAGVSHPMSHESGNTWDYPINTQDYVNGPYTVTYTATGNGVSGSGSTSFTIDNPTLTSYDVTYFQGVHSYSINQTTSPMGFGPSEGGFETSSTALALQPTAAVTSIQINTPGTVSGLAWMLLPFGYAPGLVYSNTLIDSWTEPQPSTHVFNLNAGASITSTAFGFPVLTAPSTGGGGSFSSTGLPVNVTSFTSIGGVFNVSSTNAVMFGNYIALVVTPDGSNAIYPTVKLENETTSATEWLVSNTAVPLNTWFTFAANVAPQAANQAESQLFIDGQQVTWHQSGSVASYDYFNFVATNWECYNVSEFDMYAVSSQLTLSQIVTILSPLEAQLQSLAVSPPFYTLSADYYAVTITNGTQEWPAYLDVPFYEPVGINTAQINLLLTSVFGPQLYNNYIVNVSYQPYFSLTTYRFDPLSEFFAVPVGSIMTINVVNLWNQSVGTISDFYISSTSITISMSLNLATLDFTFYNTTENFVLLSANGITSQDFASALVGLNYTYYWNTTVYTNGQNIVYSGKVTVIQPTQDLIIYANAPPAVFTVSVFGYNTSGEGQLYSTGNPYVSLFLDGQLYPIGSTYPTNVGAVVSVVVTDALNQTLYATNYTIYQTQVSLVVQLSQRSWVLGLTNDEQVISTSPLATETIWVNNTNGHAKGVFHDSVGNELELYLLQGNYTISLRDNATFQTTVNLNQSQYYVIFGQQLVTLAQFNRDINQILNNSAKLVIDTQRQPTLIGSDSPTSFQYSLTFPDGSPVVNTELDSLIRNSTFTIYLADDGVTSLGSLSAAGGILFGNFTSGGPGQYDFVIDGYAGFNGQLYGYSISGFFGVSTIGVVVDVFGYNSSGQNMLTGTGMGAVHLYVDHVLSPIGSEVTCPIGLVNFTVTDSINQTLYSATQEVTSQTNSVNVYITKPSWQLVLRNDENAPAGTVLATEVIWVNSSTGTGMFTDIIGAVLDLYLLQGNYTVQVHDNLTASVNLTVDKNVYYVFFGQSILTLTEFDKQIGVIVNESAKLDVIVIRQSTQMLPHNATSFQYQLSYQNGTLLTERQLASFVQNSSFDIYLVNSSSAVPVSISSAEDVLYVNFTSGNIGEYDYVMEGYLSIGGQNYGTRYASSFRVTVLLNTSYGLNVAINGAQTIQGSTNNTYVISLQYGAGPKAGSLLNTTDTKSVLLNTSVDIYLNGLFVKLLKPAYDGAGQLAFIVNITDTNDYVLVVIVSPTRVGPLDVNATAYKSINVVPYNPNGNTGLEQLTLFLNQFGLIIGIITGIPTVIYALWRFARRKPNTRKRDMGNIQNTVIGVILHRWLNGVKLTPWEENVLDNVRPEVLWSTLITLRDKNPPLLTGEIDAEILQHGKKVQVRNLKNRPTLRPRNAMPRFYRLRRDVDE